MPGRPDAYTGKVLTDSQLAEEGMGLMFGGLARALTRLLSDYEQAAPARRPTRS
jgi:hypothetical protein